MNTSVVHFVESAEFGGTEQALLHLMAGLNQRGWRQTLLHHSEQRLAPLLAGAHQLSVPRQVVRRRKGPRAAVAILRIAQTLKSERPDIFHAHLHWPGACQPALLAATLARVPVIVLTFQLFGAPPPRLPRYLQRFVIGPRAACFIAVSHAIGRQLQQTFGVPRQKVRVIHNAVPVASFAGPCHPIDSIAAGTAEQAIVMTTARLDSQKGLRHLLEAVKLVPGARFVVVGDGPERGALLAHASELGVHQRVEFLGYRSDVPNLLAQCDLFVLPSVYEGLPLALVEAMAAERAVVASDIAGINEVVVDNQTGLLVRPGDPVGLAGAINTLLQDPQRARRFGRAGRARAEQHFSAEVMVKAVEDVYHDLLAAT